jgi:5-oxopent-3-ene-1,2,5-tricarboxylate decarboxylase/2-hydroxyhepta-2,4-diene-1,7-dioate isomerase
LNWAPAAAGQVYGVALNHREELRVLGSALSAPPYKEPPRAAVLYLKPANTHASHRAQVALPRGAEGVEVGGTVGIVLGRTASRVGARAAMDYISGYTLALDLCLAGAGLHRPPIRESCFDGACPIGPWWIDRDDVNDPHAIEVAITVNDHEELRWRLDDLVRPIPALLAHVSAFMTLDVGDVLLAGLPAHRPRAQAGDRIAVAAAQLGRLECELREGGS